MSLTLNDVWNERIVQSLVLLEQFGEVLEVTVEAVHGHVVVPRHAGVLGIPADVNNLQTFSLTHIDG